jgi:hypothetical protein
MSSSIIDLSAIIDLDGGIYKISQPIYVPPMYGNLLIQNGVLRASCNFSNNGYAIEIGNSDECHPNPENGRGVCHQFINIENILIDCRNASKKIGGIKLDKVMGGTITTVFIVGFSTVGVQINEGHEIMMSNSWLAQYYWGDVVDQHIDCRNESSVGIQLNGNDHYITNVIIFDCTKIGVQINRPANILMGVHTWNGGKIGIQVRAHQTRIIGCYLDYNSLDVHGPMKSIQVEDTFFFHTGIKLFNNTTTTGGIAPSAAMIDGLIIQHNSFNINEKDGDPIQLHGSFEKIKNVQIADN